MHASLQVQPAHSSDSLMFSQFAHLILYILGRESIPLLSKQSLSIAFIPFSHSQYPDSGVVIRSWHSLSLTGTLSLVWSHSLVERHLTHPNLLSNLNLWLG